MYINVNNNDYYQQKTTYTFIYIQKSGKMRNFLYTRSHTLYQKEYNLRCVFIYKMPDTLGYAIFHEISEISISIQKA